LAAAKRKPPISQKPLKKKICPPLSLPRTELPEVMRTTDFQFVFRKDYHKYLNVTGGFLSGTVERQKDKPTFTFRWHNVKGRVLRIDVTFP